MAVITTLIVSILGKVLADEVKDCLPRLTMRLLSRAASKLPPFEQARYHDEWSAHAHDVPGALSRLWFAARMNRAALEMRADFCIAMTGREEQKTKAAYVLTRTLLHLARRAMPSRLYSCLIRAANSVGGPPFHSAVLSVMIWEANKASRLRLWRTAPLVSVIDSLDDPPFHD